MRKTLTALTILAAAASLAACKPFWQHDDKPAAVATTEPAATEPTATTGDAKPEQTATTSPDAPKPDVPTAPAKK